MKKRFNVTGICIPEKHFVRSSIKEMGYKVAVMNRIFETYLYEMYYMARIRHTGEDGKTISEVVI